MNKVNFDADGSAEWACNFLQKYPLDEIETIEVHFVAKENDAIHSKHDVTVTVTFKDKDSTIVVVENGFRAGIFSERVIYLYDFLKRCNIPDITASSVYFMKKDRTFYPGDDSWNKF